MMSEKTYTCTECGATCSPEEARQAVYRCSHCQNGHLIALHHTPCSVAAVRPADIDVEHAPVAPAVEQDVKPPTLEAALRSALVARRSAPTEEASEAVPAGDDASPSGPADPTQVATPTTSSQVSAWLVLPPPFNEIDAAAMEQLAGTFGRLPSPIALEIAGEHGQRRLIIRGAPQAVQRLTHQLYRVYRQVGIEPLNALADPLVGFTNTSSVTRVACLQPAGPEFLPLKTWREFEGNDPLGLLLGAFDGLAPGERALSQVIISGEAPEGWAEPHLKQLVTLKRRGYGADAPAPIRNILGFTGGSLLLLVGLCLTLWALGDGGRWFIVAPTLFVMLPPVIWLFRLGRNPWTMALDEEAVAKLREQAFRVDVRLFALAHTPERADDILEQLIAAYQLFNTSAGNRFQVVKPEGEVAPSGLSSWPGTKASLLSVKELAGLWHMPVGESLELVARETFERLLPLPGQVSYSGGAPIGAARKGDQAISAQLAPEALNRNTFVIGKTQHGKSTFMEHVAAQWMRDPERAILIVDPHGDLARRAIGFAPPERAGDVIYIDLSDLTQSVGLNMLDVSDGSEPDDVAETFVDVGKALWQNYWGPRMLIPLGFGLRALAHANLKRPPERQYTLLSLATLLTCNAGIRDDFLRREVTLAARPDIFRYFTGEFAEGNAYQREQVISPVLSKAHAFERSAAVRRLVGQPRSTVHLFDAIRSRKIIIVNTNSGVLGNDLAGFIGSLFLNVMRRVITRQTMLPRTERVRVSVVADEFQTMTGTDFGALLGELQKNGGNFVLGTQSLDGLRRMDESGALAGTIFAGIATLVVMRVNGDDAQYLVERELDVERLHPESLVNLPPHIAYVKTIDNSGRPIPVYSVEITEPLQPDSAVLHRVEALRPAYTVPADEAERLSRLALSIFDDEYAYRVPEGDPQALSADTRAATSMLQSVQTPVAGEEMPPVDPDQKARPRLRPPGWANGPNPDATMADVAAKMAERRGGG